MKKFSNCLAACFLSGILITVEVSAAQGLRGTAGAIEAVGHMAIAEDGSITDVWGYFDARANRAYALVGRIGEQSGVIIVDVTVPGSPTIAAEMTEVPGYDVKTWCHYMYSVTGFGDEDAGKVVDICNPGKPIVVGSFNSSHNITITDDGYMILEVPGLRIMDLNPDPTSPHLLWEGGQGGGHDAAVINGILYDFHGFSGTFIYDFANPANPTLISAIRDPQINHHHSGWTTADNQYLFICDELASNPAPDIVIYDISDLDDPVRVGGIGDPTATVHNIYVIGDILYASYYSAGFKVFNVSDPINPVLIDQFDTSDFAGENLKGAWGIYPFAPSDRIYISDRETGLHVFELRDVTTVGERENTPPAAFVLHGNFPNPSNQETTIRYDLAVDSDIRLDIYNALGQHVRTLENTRKSVGSYRVVWDGRDDYGGFVGTGVYFYRLKVAGFIQTRRMLLLK